ncbi:MAG TPA: hypothetical protein VEF72_00920 [Mycobacterium sp.]|nr:hypothetical protein [Mycobacterium sp.]
MPDEESLPKTEPHTPVFDTGRHPFEPLAAERESAPPACAGPSAPDPSMPQLKEQPKGADPSATAGPQVDPAAGAPPSEPIPAQSVPTAAAPPSEPIPAPAQSITVPGRYYYLKWWKLVLVIAGVWVVTAAIGLGLFYWWYHSINKTPAVFVVLIYIVVCTVSGLMLAMVQDRPLLSALGIAVMSALFASVAAAAPLYGYYYCQRMPHCLVRLIPY